MDYKLHVRFELQDRSFLNIVKRDITKLAESFGFSETETGKLNILVAEMASNLIKHTPKGGEILVKPIGGEERITGIEILSLDTGPGMTDPKRMMEDGISTYGSKGEGLGAIKRIADEFDLYSRRDSGTVLLARLFKKGYKPKASQRSRFDLNAVKVAKPGETFCGDGWSMVQQPETCRILIVDGLGHGENAHLAASAAVTSFQKQSYTSPASQLREVHQDLLRTRGGVMNIATIDLKNNTLTYCGIGNISGRILATEGSRNIISYNGIVGHNLPNTINDHQLPWNNTNILILHSDGLKTRWDLNKHPDLLSHDTSLIAAVLYKECNRKTDDTLVLVARTRP
ncbi:SpoIIE family protein phosphatase [Adhaeribacter radiodurans]|uniref:SpoIIE family protein phosphatase n=1 Tax=Adhaeribacter radiodurans TaxID=2745197 RepID=A0A7L7L8L5_9BACT|nr:SpoIIE family protein phosphatase [Adhaeribacter radiodurans]QMU29161.1 SpoIIE family protein phosphatase [Adhaeribacter radiodurans]